MIAVRHRLFKGKHFFKYGKRKHEEIRTVLEQKVIQIIINLLSLFNSM